MLATNFNLRKSAIAPIGLALLVTTLSSAAAGQDSFGYTATSSVPYSYINIAPTGTAVLASTDDGTAVLSLPFSFRFYGTTYTSLCVSSNGLIGFGGCPVNDMTNLDLTSQSPTGNLPLIAPFWMDLSFATPGAGAIVYQTMGVAPSRQFVIQWNNTYGLNAPGALNFQVILSETTNAILFQYQSVESADTSVNKGATATVGLRGASGEANHHRQQWSYHVPVLSNNMAIQFSYPPPVGVGLYRSGVWTLDSSRNGVYDPGVDPSFNWGYAGTTRIQGDWNGDGKEKAGLYVDGVWYLDYNGDGVWDGGTTDKVYGFGMAGAQPVVGDWNGDGKDKIGIYINGFWFLDVNGNGVWDGETTDKMIVWGFAGSTPVIGDWNGDGRKKVGLFYSGLWYLDYNGDGVWDGGTADKVYGFGMSGVEPMVGDWIGDGKQEIGIYIGGFWFLDINGNGLWDGEATDRMTILGWAGTTPVVGDWNGDGRAKLGTFINGYWYLDYNGNGAWDGESTDRAYVFGQAGDTPVVGRW